MHGPTRIPMIWLPRRRRRPVERGSSPVGGRRERAARVQVLVDEGGDPWREVMGEEREQRPPVAGELAPVALAVRAGAGPYGR
jgi:hypothetical protein